MEIKIEGLAVSSGLGMARVFVFKNIPFELTGKPLEEQEIQTGLECLEKAFTKSLEDLKESEDMAASIKNPLFHGSIKDRILSGQCPEDAVVQTTHDLVVIFRESPDPLFRARADAVEEAARRLLRHLHGLETPVFSKEHPLIIATDELTAFDVTRLTPGVVAGIISQRGGETSHFAILAKQMGIPCVSGIKDLEELIPHNALCICDGIQGQVVVEPDQATRETTRQRIGQIRAEKQETPYLAEEPEENPNLGWQGLRMCLDRKPLFLAQLSRQMNSSRDLIFVPSAPMI